ncbi:hypothetical protein G7Y89_g3922 [Neofusicoccum parvum]|uniref:Uncharacterized protein n=1 Tax=Neofusicoccum parvum TaxID=310453 RepID=A0ACB5SBM6_9PEZI|nr:hypothetical protein G7Y89_g3922 [Neofusicoccum parvum]
MLLVTIMAPLQIPALLAYILVSLLAIITYVVYQLHLSPLKSVPGPLWAKLSPWWRVVKVSTGNWQQHSIDLHEKYGRIVRIAPNEISITDPEAINKVYGHTGHSWRKAKWYHTWDPGDKVKGPHPLFNDTNVSRHREHRRMLSRAYSMTYSLGLETYIDPVITCFMKKMHSLVGSKLDLSIWAQFLAYDVMSELAFGQPWRLMEKGYDELRLLESVHVHMACASVSGWTWKQYRAAFFALPRWILNNTILKRLKKTIDRHPRGVIEDIVRKNLRLSANPDRRDLLAHFVSIEKPDGRPLTQLEIFGESMTVVNAGADTSAISFRAAVRYIASSPRVCKRLQQEIDEAAADGRLSDVVQYSEAQNLPYFQAVLKEALRIFPAVGFDLPRRAPKGGTQLAGIWLPENSVVAVNAWSLHRNRDIYGEDAKEFRPERWLEGDHRLMDACFGSFGFGNRTCVGKNLALLELNKMLPTLFRDFDVDICHPDQPWDVITSWFSYQADFFVRMAPRKQNCTTSA